jgi:hypothetical protein
MEEREDKRSAEISKTIDLLGDLPLYQKKVQRELINQLLNVLKM